MTCLVGLATALVLSTSACDPYTYYNIDVTFPPSGDANAVNIGKTLPQVYSCDVAVYASDRSDPVETGIPLNERTAGPKVSPCRGAQTPYPDLGILDYSTARSSGSLSFRVNVYDSSNAVIIQGFTTPAAVSPGNVLPTLELVAYPCGPATTTEQPNQQTCK